MPAHSHLAPESHTRPRKGICSVLGDECSTQVACQPLITGHIPYIIVSGWRDNSPDGLRPKPQGYLHVLVSGDSIQVGKSINEFCSLIHA